MYGSTGETSSGGQGHSNSALDADSLYPEAPQALQQNAEGAAARSILAAEGIQVDSLFTLDISARPDSSGAGFFLTMPEKDSVGGEKLDVDWRPKLRYNITPASDGCTITIESDSESPKLKIHLGPEHMPKKMSLDVLSERYVEKLEKALRDTIEAAKQASGKALRRLPVVSAIKESALEQRDRYQEKGRGLLRRIRSILVAWATVGLREVEEGPVPHVEHDRYLAPKSLHSVSMDELPGGREPVEKERKSIAERSSRSGLFIRDLLALWTLIRDRNLEDHGMLKMGKLIGIPGFLTLRSVAGVEAIYEELTAIDEDIVRSQALVAASEAVSAFILERGCVPDMSDVQPSFEPTNRQLNDARAVLLAVEKKRDSRTIESYSNLEDVVDEHWNEIGLTSREKKKRTGSSIVKNSKRAAERLEICDYQRTKDENWDDLLRALRYADEEGEIPR